MARLDTVFVASAMLGALWLRTCDRRSRAVAVVAFAVPVGLYVVTNLAWFGAAVPVSGLLKSTFPVPCPTGWRMTGVNTSISGFNVVFGWIPLTLTLAACWRLRVVAPTAYAQLWPLAVGLVAQTVYVGLFTHHPDSWLWHYVVPVTVGAWATALLIDHELPQRMRPRVATAVMALALMGAGGYAVRACIRSLPRSDSQIVVDWLRAQDIRDATLLVSDGPGEIAFVTANRIIGLDLLTTNATVVQQVLGAANPLQQVLQQAKMCGRSVDYVVVTTGTWLTATRVASDGQTLQARFLSPGACRQHKVGQLQLGACRSIPTRS
ncbi:MAG: hypothetical protein EXR77_09795 [Myxococcales bacterium]|nr:hypothetical protein [Myxococcales bacterium]